jgi:hypothetical protein
MAGSRPQELNGKSSLARMEAYIDDFIQLAQTTAPIVQQECLSSSMTLIWYSPPPLDMS